MTGFYMKCNTRLNWVKTEALSTVISYPKQKQMITSHCFHKSYLTGKLVLVKPFSVALRNKESR